MTDFIDRLERACSRAEYEFPRLAAPDGTVAVPFVDLRQLLRSKGSAVAATSGETPEPSPVQDDDAELVEWLRKLRAERGRIYEVEGDEVDVALRDAIERLGKQSLDR